MKGHTAAVATHTHTATHAKEIKLNYPASQTTGMRSVGGRKTRLCENEKEHARKNQNSNKKSRTNEIEKIKQQPYTTPQRYASSPLQPNV